MKATPQIGEKYSWIAYKSIVEISDIRSEVEKERLHSDGSFTPSRTAYSVKIKDITSNGKFENSEIWIPWCAGGFEEII